MKLSRPGKAANRDGELRFLHRYVPVHAAALAACGSPSTENEGSSASSLRLLGGIFPPVGMRGDLDGS